MICASVGFSDLASSANTLRCTGTRARIEIDALVVLAGKQRRIDQMVIRDRLEHHGIAVAVRGFQRRGKRPALGQGHWPAPAGCAHLRRPDSELAFHCRLSISGVITTRPWLPPCEDRKSKWATISLTPSGTSTLNA